MKDRCVGRRREAGPGRCKGVGIGTGDLCLTPNSKPASTTACHGSSERFLPTGRSRIPMPFENRSRSQLSWRYSPVESATHCHPVRELPALVGLSIRVALCLPVENSARACCTSASSLCPLRSVWHKPPRNPGDTTWELFGGLCSSSLAALHTRRQFYVFEIIPVFFPIAARCLHRSHLGGQ